MTAIPAAPVTSPAARLLALLPYALDIVLPVASYATLKALGASTFWALAVGGLLTAGNSLVNTVRRRRLDKLGALVLLEVALGLVLDFVVRDPRLMLARGSLYLAIGGLWMLANAFTARPLTVDAAKPMAAKGGPKGIAAYEWCAANDARFVRIHRVLSLVWSLMFLAYAVLRVVIIYSASSVDQSIWLNEIPGLVTVGSCLFASKLAGKRLATIVTARIGAPAAARTVPASNPALGDAPVPLT
jgi:hypothetical protein